MIEQVQHGEVVVNTYMILVTIASWYCVPLNSALNPLVYFCRIKQMRVYLGEVWGRMRGCGRRRVYPGRPPSSWS